MKIGSKVKAFVQNVSAAKAGVYLQLPPTKEQINEALKLFRPRETEYDLVRVGADGDSGYLLPDDLEGISGVFSPGVDQNAEFELFFAQRGVPCYLIDASVARSPIDHENLNFEPLWLSEKSVPDYSISLEDWVQSKPMRDDNLILQIDIEGAEFESLLAAKQETLERFRIIVIELHDLRSIATTSGLRLVSILMRHLLEKHVIVHTHVNNCYAPLVIRGTRLPQVLELTLLRKDRIKNQNLKFAKVPHTLDQPNTNLKDWHLSWD